MTTENKTRPWYMPEDCGKWCRAGHEPNAELGDRECWSDSFEIPLSYMPGVGEGEAHEPEGYLVNLRKEWRAIEPIIDLGWIQGSLDTVHLTLGEAERLAFILTKLVDIARDGEPTDPIAAELDESIGMSGHRRGHHPDYHGVAS